MLMNMVTCTFAEFESRNLTLKKMRRKQMGENSGLHFAFPLTFFSVFIRSIVTRKKKQKKTTLLLVVSIAYDSDAKHGT